MTKNKKITLCLRLIGALLLCLAACAAAVVVMSSRDFSPETSPQQSSQQQSTSPLSSVPASTPMPKGVWKYSGSGRYTFEDDSDTFISLPGSVLVGDTYYVPVYSGFKSEVIYCMLHQADGYTYVNLPESYLHDLADYFDVTAVTAAADLPFVFNCVSRDGDSYTISSLTPEVTSSSYTTGFAVKIRLSGSSSGIFLTFKSSALTQYSDLNPYFAKLYETQVSITASCTDSRLDALIRPAATLETVYPEYVGGGSYGVYVRNLTDKLNAHYSAILPGYAPELLSLDSVNVAGSYLTLRDVSLTNDAQYMYMTVYLSAPYYDYVSNHLWNTPFSVGAEHVITLSLTYTPPELVNVQLNYVDIESGEPRSVTIQTYKNTVPDLSAYVKFNDEYAFDCYIVQPHGGQVEYFYDLPKITMYTFITVSYSNAPKGDYAVTFEYFDYTALEFKSVEWYGRAGRRITLPEDILLDSDIYRFKGWVMSGNQGGDYITELPIAEHDVTFTAAYDVAPFNIHYSYIHPISGETVSGTTTAEFGKSLTYRPQVSHHVFQGWYTDAAFGGSNYLSTPVVTDLTLYGNILRDKKSYYTVSWNFNSDQYAQTSVFALDAPQPPDCSALVPEGYVFSHYEQLFNGNFLRIDALPDTVFAAMSFNIVYVSARDYYHVTYADKNGVERVKHFNVYVGTDFTPQLDDLSPYFSSWQTVKRADGLNTHYDMTAQYLTKSVDLTVDGVKQDSIQLDYTTLKVYGSDCRYCLALGADISPGYGYYFCFAHELSALLSSKLLTSLDYTGATVLSGNSGDIVNKVYPVVFDYNSACSISYATLPPLTLTLDITIGGESVDRVDILSGYDYANNRYTYFFNLTSWLEDNGYKAPDNITLSTNMNWLNRSDKKNEYRYDVYYPAGITAADVTAVIALEYKGKPQGFWSSVGDFFGGLGSSLVGYWQSMGNIFTNVITGLDGFVAKITSSPASMTATIGVLLLIAGAVAFVVILIKSKGGSVS